MAINKVEGIFSEMVVIFYNGHWYGIPYSQLVQLSCVIDHFGLTVTSITLQDDDVAVITCEPTPMDIVADRVVQLGLRFARISRSPVMEIKRLIDRFPTQFPEVLVSTLIP